MAPTVSPRNYVHILKLNSKQILQEIKPLGITEYSTFCDPVLIPVNTFSMISSLSVADSDSFCIAR